MIKVCVLMHFFRFDTFFYRFFAVSKPLYKLIRVKLKQYSAKNSRLYESWKVTDLETERDSI